MAQTMTAASIGRVNRRFLFLALILAALSAVLVYPLLTRSSGSDGGAAGNIPVVVAKSNIAAGETITGELLSVQQIPETAVGALAFSETDAVVGEVARYPIVVGARRVGSLPCRDPLYCHVELAESVAALTEQTYTQRLDLRRELVLENLKSTSGFGSD